MGTIASSAQVDPRVADFIAQPRKMLINGHWVDSVSGKTFPTYDPSTGEVLATVAEGDRADIDLAVKAARQAFEAGPWRKMSASERGRLIWKLGDLIDQHLEEFAFLESLDNGKPLTVARAADVPLAAELFRYMAGWATKLEGNTIPLSVPYTPKAKYLSYTLRDPIGVVGQIIPWNFPLLMAAWKLGPALATGCTIILKPAEQTPASILVLLELIQDLLPAGVLNVVNGFGLEAGKPLASNKRIAKIAFTGETTTGRLIMQYASQNIIPVTLELGGKSPNIFFADVLDKDDSFFDKALEGFAMFALNQGEVCTCPSRVLIEESIYDRFMERAVKRVAAIQQGHPLDSKTMIGAQASQEQLEKILSYIDLGKQEGAQCLIGGEQNKLDGELSKGYYVKPTVFRGHNKMRIFQEEIFGPVVSVTTFKNEEEALEIANDTLYGLGAGVWTRDGTRAYRFGREIQAGRVWTNCYHAYPAHAAFGGYKQSGIGRENHKMMLDHYQQTKNLLVSYSDKPLGFF